jgi:thioredoxin-like negative regulator of GroEL
VSSRHVLARPFRSPGRRGSPTSASLEPPGGRIRVGKLHVDENPATAARFDVRSIPTLLVLKDGREVDRIVGAQPKAEILRRLMPLVA